MQIDYTIHLAFKRLSAKYRISTLERHWERIVRILKAYNRHQCI